MKRCFVLIGFLSVGCSAESPVPSSRPALTSADSAEDGLVVKQVVLKLPGMV
ncbi:MAG TPA: hypothetical protein VND64_04350 [Pirellulales bacterium]|nr:hypothetical protein [Pirellulales bacterium]